MKVITITNVGTIGWHDRFAHLLIVMTAYYYIKTILCVALLQRIT